MNSFFTDLGRAVLAEWQARDFSLPAFPEIAVRALEKNRPSEHVDVDALLRDFLLEDHQPVQTQSGFGQPELVVFSDPRIYIQILFWQEGTTDIHQHEFSGAFHVLAGSSIHSLFAFERAEAVNSHLRLGHLRMLETHLLETGSTMPIVSGSEFVHSLFHLDHPSATVVVRTQNDPGTGPQFTYLPPHVAVDPVQDDALTMRRKQLLDLLEQTGHTEYGELVRAMLGRLDFGRGFFILQNCESALRDLGEWDPCWAVFREKHGKRAELVPPTLKEIARRDVVASLRATVTDPDHRFFLALLLNLPGREDILKMIGQRYPGDARAKVVNWAEELIEQSEEGVAILDAVLPVEAEGDGEAEGVALVTALAKAVGIKVKTKVASALMGAAEEALRASSLGVLMKK